MTSQNNCEGNVSALNCGIPSEEKIFLQKSKVHKFINANLFNPNIIRMQRELGMQLIMQIMQ